MVKRPLDDNLCPTRVTVAEAYGRAQLAQQMAGDEDAQAHVFFRVRFHIPWRRLAAVSAACRDVWLSQFPEDGLIESGSIVPDRDFRPVPVPGEVHGHFPLCELQGILEQHGKALQQLRQPWNQRLLALTILRMDLQADAGTQIGLSGSLYECGKREAVVGGVLILVRTICELSEDLSAALSFAAQESGVFAQGVVVRQVRWQLSLQLAGDRLDRRKVAARTR